MSVPLKRARSAGFTAWLIRANTFYHCTDKSQNIAALSRAGPGIVTSARCKLSAVLLFTDQTWGDPRPAGSWSGEPSSPCPPHGERSVALGMLQPRGREERSCFAIYPHGTRSPGCSEEVHISPRRGSSRFSGGPGGRGSADTRGFSREHLPVPGGCAPSVFAQFTGTQPDCKTDAPHQRATCFSHHAPSQSRFSSLYPSRQIP